MLILISVVIFSLIFLIISADKFVHGAASIASKLKVSPLIIGLLILGFGTSAPEIMVSIFASLDNKPEIALGNALGSNIANVGMVLGATALVYPIMIKSLAIRKEFILFIASIIATYALILDYDLSRTDSFILIGLLILILGWIIITSQSSTKDPLQIEVETDKEIPQYTNLTIAILVTLAGLIVLLISSKALVWAASGIASQLGLSDLVIGLTIVAIGTSLPELAASIVAAMRKEHDMVIGNIIGSNLFNLLAVIGISGVIQPFAISSLAIHRDFLLMSLLSVLLFTMIFIQKKEVSILSRASGFILLMLYLCYLGLIAYQST